MGMKWILKSWRNSKSDHPNSADHQYGCGVYLTTITGYGATREQAIEVALEEFRKSIAAEKQDGIEYSEVEI